MAQVLILVHNTHININIKVLGQKHEVCSCSTIGKCAMQALSDN